MKPESPVNRALRLIREDLLCAIEGLRKDLNEDVRDGQRSAGEAYVEGRLDATERS